MAGCFQPIYASPKKGYPSKMPFLLNWMTDKRFRRKQAPAYNPASAYALDHARTLVFSLGRLYRSPLSSLLTTAVIGIALALPCAKRNATSRAGQFTQPDL